MLRSASTRTAGFAIAIAAIWGGLIPFAGPYFHFTLGPDHVWTWTSGRLYLSVLPAIAALLGGLVLMGAGPWASGRIGALLALLGGIWFAIGPELSYLWHTGGQLGAAHGTPTVQAMERLGLHTGVGVVIAALAGFALPAVVAYRRTVEPVAATPAAVPAATAAPATTAPPTTTAGPTTTAAPTQPVAPAAAPPAATEGYTAAAPASGRTREHVGV